MKLCLPEYAVQCIRTLELSGFEAWAVGGAVRDLLCGVTPHDVDIASSASPDQVRESFDRVIDTGLKFGTVTVLTGGGTLEITQYRCDGSYSDSRHPDDVQPARTIDDDLSRRDFTINAMAYHPERGLLDHFGGQEDLQAGIIRAVGDPGRRFSEDALRILRAFRFSARFGFTIEKDTLRAALEAAPALSAVSAERVLQELTGILAAPYPSRMQPLVDSGGLDCIGLGRGNLALLDRIEPDRELRFAALCFLCRSAPGTVCERLKSDKKLRRMSELYTGEWQTDDFADPEPPRVKRALRRTGFTPDEYGRLCRAGTLLTGIPTDAVQTALRRLTISPEPYLLPHLALSGEDLRQMGFSGRKLGKMQQYLLEAVTDRPELNQADQLRKLCISARKEEPNH